VMVGNLCWFCYVGSRINGFDRSAQLWRTDPERKI